MELLELDKIKDNYVLIYNTKPIIYFVKSGITFKKIDNTLHINGKSIEYGDNISYILTQTNNNIAISFGNSISSPTQQVLLKMGVKLRFFWEKLFEN
jgi:hypothetical protein